MGDHLGVSASLPLAVSITEAAALFGGAVALAGIVASLEVARRQRKHAAEIAERQHRQVIDFQGTEMCISYRNHVIALYDRGLTEQQIRQLLIVEGEAEDPRRPGRLMLERDDRKEGCAPIGHIIRLVGPRRSQGGMPPRSGREPGDGG